MSDKSGCYIETSCPIVKDEGTNNASGPDSLAVRMGYTGPEIVLYHAAWCRSLRVRMLLEELCVPYKLVMKRYCPEELQSPEYLKVHPMGQLPAMSYGDIHMWESGAIVEFLLGVLPSGTLTKPPPGTKEQARWLQFLHFAESLMTPVHDIVAHTHDRADSIPQVVEEARPRLAKRLAYLDGELAHNKYVLGEHFSAADIMLVYTIATLEALTSELDGAAVAYPNVMSYLARLKERPSYKAAYDDEFNVD